MNEPSSQRRTLFSTGIVLFLLLGVLQTIYGPALTAFSTRFSITIETVSMLVSTHFFGAFFATLITGWILERLWYRKTLLMSVSLIGVGAVVVGFAPVWTLALVGAFVAGFGVGLTNSGMTVYVSRVFAPRHGPVLNLLNSLFGVGAVLAPLIVTWVGMRISLPFYAAAIMAIIAFVMFLRLPNSDAPIGNVNPWAVGAAWPILAGFAFLYFFYVSTEAGVTTWEIQHITPLVGAQQAAVYTSLYWAAITIGRFIGTALSLRFSAKSILLGATGGSVVAMTLAHIPTFAPFAYILVGFFIAPIFANGLAWLAQMRPKQADQLIPLAMAAASLGPVGTTPLIAAAVASNGIGVIPTALTICAASMFIATLWLSQRKAVTA